MLKSWKKISENRLLAEHPDDFYVIIPEGEDKIIPLYCPNCKILMKDQDDPHSYREYKCCSRCSTRWAQGANKKKWSEGWRPSKEEIREVLEEFGIGNYI